MMKMVMTLMMMTGTIIIMTKTNKHATGTLRKDDKDDDEDDEDGDDN